MPSCLVFDPCANLMIFQSLGKNKFAPLLLCLSVSSPLVASTDFPLFPVNSTQEAQMQHFWQFVVDVPIIFLEISKSFFIYFVKLTSGEQTWILL